MTDSFATEVLLATLRSSLIDHGINAEFFIVDQVQWVIYGKPETTTVMRLVLEEAPGRRLIRWRSADDIDHGSDQHLYHIPTPWLYHRFTLTHNGLSRAASLEYNRTVMGGTSKNQVGIPFLPNIYRPSYCCFSGNFTGSITPDRLPDALASVIDHFWNTSFNTDGNVWSGHPQLRLLGTRSSVLNEGAEVHREGLRQLEKLSTEEYLHSRYWPKSVTPWSYDDFCLGIACP